MIPALKPFITPRTPVKCMHEACTICHGSGRRPDGTACVHAMACPCAKCRPGCM